MLLERIMNEERKIRLKQNDTQRRIKKRRMKAAAERREREEKDDS